MIALSYVSRASHRFDNQQLTELLTHCHRVNGQKNITGLLLYNGSGTFLQVLEGEQETIEKLYLSICSDKRHSRVNCISRKLVPQRNFPDWKMGFRNLVNEPINSMSGFSDFMQTDDKEDYLSKNPSMVDSMLLHFKNKSNEVAL